MLEIQKKLTNGFYAILSLPATAMGFALSVQISALSWILSTKYGFDIHDVGIVWAAGPLAGIIAQPIVGAISDKVWFWGGRRRPFIIIGGILAALMLFALPNMDIIGKAVGSTGATMGIAIAIALTLDLSINVSFNPTRSIIADVTPEGDKRTRGYTWMQTISGTFGVLAYAIGAVLGNEFLVYFGAFLVVLLSLFPFFPKKFIVEPNVLGTYESDDTATVGKSAPVAKYVSHETERGSNAMFTLFPLLGFLIYGVYVIVAKLFNLDSSNSMVEWMTVGLVVVAGLVVLVMSAAKEKNDLEFMKILLAHAFTWIGVQTMFIYMFAFAKENVLMLEYLDDMPRDLRDAQDKMVGRVSSIAFLILNLVGALFPAFVLNPMARAFGRVRTHALSLSVMAVAYFGVMLLPQTEIMLYVLMAFVGVGWASVISLPFAIMSERVDQAKMGLYMGIFNLSVVLPQLVASFKMNQIVGEAADKDIMFLISGSSLAISALLWFMVREGKSAGALPVSGGGAH